MAKEDLVAHVIPISEAEFKKLSRLVYDNFGKLPAPSSNRRSTRGAATSRRCSSKTAR